MTGWGGVEHGTALFCSFVLLLVCFAFLLGAIAATMGEGPKGAGYGVLSPLLSSTVDCVCVCVGGWGESHHHHHHHQQERARERGKKGTPSPPFPFPSSFDSLSLLSLLSLLHLGWIPFSCFFLWVCGNQKRVRTLDWSLSLSLSLSLFVVTPSTHSHTHTHCGEW